MYQVARGSKVLAQVEDTETGEAMLRWLGPGTRLETPEGVVLRFMAQPGGPTRAQYERRNRELIARREMP